MGLEGSETAGMARAKPSATASPAFLSGRRGTMAVQLHDHLRRQIVDGRLPPRHQLSENELSASLGASRTPIREAFGKLEEEGLVEIVPQYGTFVAPIRVEDVYNNQFVREALECAALRLAVERLTAADVRTLRGILADQSRHRNGDSALFFEADEAMHAALMTIAGHQRTWRVVENAKLHLDRVRRLAMQIPAKRAVVLTEHRAIIDRVIHRDAAGAVAAMTGHLRTVFHSVEIIMQAHPEFFTDAPIGTRIRKGA
jgi:DNA-binding GntR family transcriptional regulator